MFWKPSKKLFVIPETDTLVGDFIDMNFRIRTRYIFEGTIRMDTTIQMLRCVSRPLLSDVWRCSRDDRGSSFGFGGVKIQNSIQYKYLKWSVIFIVSHFFRQYFEEGIRRIIRKTGYHTNGFVIFVHHDNLYLIKIQTLTQHVNKIPNHKYIFFARFL